MNRYLAIAACLVLVVIAGRSRGLAYEPIEVEYLWQSQPKLEFEWVTRPVIPNVRATVELLQSPHATERMSACQSIVRVPNSPSFDSVELLAGLVECLKKGEPEVIVRAAMISAACQLDDGKHAEFLWSLAKDLPAAQAVVELASIRWRSAAPLATWRQRIGQPSGLQLELLRAIDGIAVVGGAADLAAVEIIALDTAHSDPIRLAAARAIGRLSADDRTKLASRLLADSLKASNANQSNSPARRAVSTNSSEQDEKSQNSTESALKEQRESSASLVTQTRSLGPTLSQALAIEVLYNSRSQQAQQLVEGVLDSGTELGQRTAFEWMCRNAIELARVRAFELTEHTDAEVRRLAIVRVSEANTERTISVLAERLNDAHPINRQLAREQLLVTANRSEQHAQQVREKIAGLLANDQWASLEQCARLCVELDQKKHADRLVELMSHKRWEVNITAAWALRHLAEEARTLDAMLRHAVDWTHRFKNNTIDDIPKESDYRRVAHLLEAFGNRRYAPSQSLLLGYVPKEVGMGLITRMTAIWACGKMWEKESNPKLVTQLCSRIADKDNMFAEPVSIRYNATLALGWIADPAARSELQRCDEPAPSPIHYATDWALGRLPK